MNVPIARKIVESLKHLVEKKTCSLSIASEASIKGERSKIAAFQSSKDFHLFVVCLSMNEIYNMWLPILATDNIGTQINLTYVTKAGESADFATDHFLLSFITRYFDDFHN